MVRAVRRHKVDGFAVLRGKVGTRPLAATLAFAENRQFNGFNGNTNAYLAEAVSGLTTRSTLYGRAEVAGKELFGVSPHEKQYAHRHWISTIGAFTVGYSHLLPRLPVALGADITLYHIPTDLETYYEPSRSFHVFVHWRPRTAHPARTCIDCWGLRRDSRLDVSFARVAERSQPVAHLRPPSRPPSVPRMSARPRFDPTDRAALLAAASIIPSRRPPRGPVDPNRMSESEPD